MISKEDFFGERTVAEIKRLTDIPISLEFRRPSQLAREIYQAANNEVFIIEEPLPNHLTDPKKFMKHGPQVYLRRFRTLDEAVTLGKTPQFLRERAFSTTPDRPRSSYSFKPFQGNDKRTRHVALVDCLEGTRIYAYCSQEGGPGIDVKPYDEARRVEKDGAEVICTVPSRTKKQDRYEIRLSSVPIIDSEFSLAVAFSLATDHVCPHKRFDIRYTGLDDQEESRVLRFDCHDIAAWFGVIDFYSGVSRKNTLPLEMNQVAIPTQTTVDYYLKLLNNVLVRDQKISSKGKLRKTNRAEKEILLWGLVKYLGHDRTFLPKTKVRNYRWSN